MSPLLYPFIHDDDWVATWGKIQSVKDTKPGSTKTLIDIALTSRAPQTRIGIKAVSPEQIVEEPISTRILCRTLMKNSGE
ncbi:hypothetical protein EBZ35_08275 [bacterium]|nr:hypothetical protein [bacterium]